MVLILPSDNMLTCPLDESHRIRKERMQFHLVKCLKNHPLQSKMKCPYNPLHILDKFAWEHHWKNDCESMPAAIEFQCNSLFNSEEVRDVASAPIITDNSLMPPCDEDWDADTYTGTYDPFESASSKPVLRMKIGLSKAKKKEWRQEERRRHQEIEANGPLQLDQLRNTQQQKSLNASMNRKPRSKPLACSADTSVLSELNMSKQSEEGDNKKPKVQDATVRLRRPHTPLQALILGAQTEKPKENVNESYAAAASSSMAKENRPKNQKILPKLNDTHSDTASMMSYASCSNPQQTSVKAIRKMMNQSSSDETEDELSERFAHLSTLEMSIQSEKAAVLERMNKKLPKLIDPESSSARGSESGFPIGLASEMPNLIAGPSRKAFVNPIPKCAAAFSGLTKKTPIVGAGRGEILDFSAYKKRSPGKTGHFSPSYAASTTSLDDLDSVFGGGDE